MANTKTRHKRPPRLKTKLRRPRPCGRCGTLSDREPERVRLFFGHVCRRCAAVVPPDIEPLAAGLAKLILSPPPLTPGGF